MQVPGFFDAVPSIRVADPLAELLGAATDGVLVYRYLDAVKLAGHSCPTVAGAWLMTRRALAQLYPQSLPQRGALRVEMRQRADEGVAGVIASVATLVTGAAGVTGFKGLAGRHGRAGLLAFDVAMQGEIRFTRTDSGDAVELLHSMQTVPRPADLALAMSRALGPDSDPAARAEFAAAWQGWVRTILIEHADDPEVVQVVA